MDKTAGNRIRTRIKNLIDTPFGRYLVPTLFVLFLVGGPLGFFLLERFVSPAISWYDNAWEFRKPVTLTYSGSPLTNEDVLVEMDTASLIAGNKIQADCDDIRLVDSDDATPLDYWIESGCNTAATQIWARVPSIPDGGKEIYLYYGNGSATNAEESWGGSINLLSAGSCPAGWTRNSDFDSLYLYGSATYGTTGGTSSHNHATVSCNGPSSPNQACRWATESSMAASIPSPHGYALQAPVNTTNNVIPPYMDMVFCEKNEISIPSSMISAFETTPSGWTRYSALDGRFPRGASTAGGTGGVSTHAHTTGGGYVGGTTSTDDFRNGTTPVVRQHQHSTSAGSTAAADNIPPYLDVIYASADADTLATSGMIGIFDELPPLGWSLFSNLQQKFAMGAASYGGTGGAATHTHSVTLKTGGPIGGASTCLAGSGGTSGAAGHTHTCTTTTNAASNLPPYITVIYGQRSNSLVTGLGDETSNAPAAPTIVAAQGLSTTSIRWNFVDNSTNEVGFKVYDTNDILKATCDSSDISYCDETGLSPNTSYTRKITAYNSQGESQFSETATRYTLAPTPTIAIDDATTSTVDLSASGISNLGSGSSGLYFDCSDSGCDTGLNTWAQETEASVTGLSANTQYNFRVKARNGDGVETGYSSSEAVYTLTDVPSLSVNTLGAESITLTADNLNNVASGSSGAYFDCTSENCDEGINEWVQTSTDTVTGLTSNTLYTFVVKARNGDGIETEYSGELVLYSGAFVPGEPTVSQVSTSSLSVRIDTNLNNSDVQYSVQDLGTGNYVNISSGELQEEESWGTYSEWGGASGINLTGLDSGTEYTIQVKARNSDSIETEFGDSSSVYTALNAPTIGTPTVLSDTSIRWNFTDNEGNETGFRVYDASDNLVATCASADLSSCDETGLTPNTSYTRKVVAYNDGGNSSFSSTRTTYTHASIPSVGTVSVTETTASIELGIAGNPESTEILLQDEESGLFVDPSTGLLVGSPSWATLAELETTINSQASGLSPNTQYSFRAKARNENDVETDYSASVSIYTLAAQPEVASVSSQSSSELSVVIDPSGNPAGTEFALYNEEESLYVNKGSGELQEEESWGTYAEFGGADGLTVGDLTPNTLHAFKVKARNGDDVQTSLSEETSGYTLANVPSGVSVTTSSSTVVNVVFGVNSNPDSTEFSIQETGSGNYVNKGTGVLQGAADWGTYSQFGEELGIGVVGLTPNTQYTFRVRARNADSVSTSFSGTDSVNTLANAPTAPTVEQLSTTSLNLVIVTAGNPSSTEFAVQEVGGQFVNKATGTLQESADWGTYAQWGSGAGKNIVGLSSGQEYEFRVKARNADSIETAYSSTSSQVTPLSSPTIGAPTVLSSTSIRWNFTDTESNEEGFRVYNSENVQVAQCVGQNLTFCDEFGLTPNTSYTRKVVAYNSIASSLPSAEQTAVTLANTPDAPAVAASSSTGLNVTLGVNNNPGATQFLVQETVSGNYVGNDGRLSSTQNWATYAQLGGNTGVTVQNLFANAQYSFQVKARNSNGVQTSNSSATSKYTLAITPSAPSVTPTASSQVNVALNTAGNPPFTQYYIQETGSGQYVNRSAGALRGSKDWSTYSQYGSSAGVSVSGLSVNSQYGFKVVARNGDGVESTSSEIASLYTLSNVPARPTVTVLGADSVRVSFTGNGNPVNTQVEIAELTTSRFANVANGTLGTGASWRALSGGTSLVLTGLTPGKQYSFGIKARNGNNVETVISADAQAVTTARPANLAEAVAVSTSAVRLRIERFDNDPSVQYSIVEAGTGMFVNKTTGTLQTTEDWGTYTEFGGDSGILVSNLNPATDYSFRANSRNSAQVVSGLGARRNVGTNAVLQNVPNELRVFLKDNNSVDPTQLSSSLRGLQGLRVAKGEFLVADIPVQFDTNRDWSSVVIDSDPDTSRVAVKVSQEQGFSGKYVMYVVKGNTNAFVLCPDAENIGQVASNCTNSVLFTGPFPQTKAVGSNTVSVSIAIINGVEYWVVDGLTGTGGQGVIYSPGEEPKAPTTENEKPEEEEPSEEEEQEKPVSPIPVVNTVVKTVQNAPKIATQAVEGVKETLDSTVGQLPKEELTAVTTTASVATVTVGVATISGGLSQIPYYLTQLVFGLLSFLGFRKTGKPYGFVYDSVTKKPITRAIVRIYDQRDRLVWTDVTDMFGAFNADLVPGKYKLLVRKSGYRFPSELIAGQSDYPLEPVYHGDFVTFSKKDTVRHIIPLDPIRKGLFSGMGTLLRNRIGYLLKQLHILIFIAGVGLAVYTYDRYPTTNNLIILLVYLPAVLLLLRALLKRPHSFGVVKDRAGNPVEGVIVGLKEMKFDRYVGKRISDSQGLYQFLVPAGVYQLEILNDDYSPVRFQGGSGIVDMEKSGDAVIAKDIIVRKKGK